LFNFFIALPFGVVIDQIWSSICTFLILYPSTKCRFSSLEALESTPIILVMQVIELKRRIIVGIQTDEGEN
jgi:hypothetical protein